MLEAHKFKKLLEEHNLRKTPARVAILKLFHDKHHAISHSHIKDKLLNTFDRVTIYRTLNSFEEKGLVHKVFDESGIGKYALCQKNCTEHEHHDDHVHFSCTRCGNIYCINELQIPKVTIPSSFKTKNIYLIAEGICKNCA